MLQRLSLETIRRRHVNMPQILQPLRYRYLLWAGVEACADHKTLDAARPPSLYLNPPIALLPSTLIIFVAVRIHFLRRKPWVDARSRSIP